MWIIAAYFRRTHSPSLVWGLAATKRSVCSLAVLGPRVGHAVDVLSSFIHVLCRSD